MKLGQNYQSVGLTMYGLGNSEITHLVNGDHSSGRVIFLRAIFPMES